MEHLNHKVGKQMDNRITTKFGRGSRIDRREKWLQYCTANGQVISNKWFQDHPSIFLHEEVQEEIVKTKSTI